MTQTITPIAAAVAAPQLSAPRRTRRARRAAGSVLRWTWILTRVVVVIVALGIGVAWKVYGFTPVAVQTGSMAPTHPPGSLLFVHEVPIEQISKGDIITFDPPGRVPRTTHRVVQEEQHGGRTYFITKGDANPVDDDWRPISSRSQDPKDPKNASYLRGVTYPGATAPRTEYGVPHLGRISYLGGVPHLRAALLALPFIVIALQMLLWIWRNDDAPSADAPPATDAPSAGGGDPETDADSKAA